MVLAVLPLIQEKYSVNMDKHSEAMEIYKTLLHNGAIFIQNNVSATITTELNDHFATKKGGILILNSHTVHGNTKCIINGKQDIIGLALFAQTTEAQCTVPSIAHECEFGQSHQKP